MDPYWIQRRNQKLGIKGPEPKKKEFDAFYNPDDPRMQCENCGCHLQATIDFHPHAADAHIIPKKLFKSVATHFLNKLRLCLDCHDKYDKTWDKAESMQIWELACERFRGFMLVIYEPEIKNLSSSLRKIYDDAILQN